ncbi:hypothetical protein [Actinomadura fibrosa]|uniref:Uncharacterized protein n=1 Tax=Actinomadura fibrosa TaxID=111802 RepID=A0ABW2XHB5_9ACTN|nr:hypothetical protein [Actinomadura fibrosa]
MKNLPADVGPYEDVCQAAAAVRDTYAAAPDRPATFGQFNSEQLLTACEAAGVELGAWDRLIVDWLTGWEPETVAVVVGLVLRAAEANR